MIGQIITDPKTGEPLDSNGNKLALSSYQPKDEIKKLFARVQKDYQVAYMLQRRPFEEFDGVSLLTRADLDQKTFAAYVGAEYVPKHRRWRWRGRKNTARNKIIGLLAHMLAGMLYPYVRAKNEDDEEDKDAARVMKILIEESLRKARYEIKFLFMVLSALVNPAVFCEVEYVEAIQRIKKRMADGSYTIVEAVDEILSGLNINTVPVDEIMLSDFYSGTGQIQPLPYVIRSRRISYDKARAIHAGKFFDEKGTDLFDYVVAGKTHVFAGKEGAEQLFDIDWTEADSNFVQEMTISYRSEDLELTYVGGVGLFDYKDPYNSNPFKHRRMCLVNDEWLSTPVYKYAMSGFEPIDPTGRFAYYKSAAFKSYWDALGQDRAHQLAYDGMQLDVIKPMFLSGAARMDGTVLIPGATVGMPQGATATPYQLGPNLAAAMNILNKEEQDLAESTQDKLQGGTATPGVTATATIEAQQNAKIMYGQFSIMVADLINQVGELTKDCEVMNSTLGKLDMSVPGELNVKFRAILAQGKDGGKNITNKVVFKSNMIGREMSDEEKKSYEIGLYNKSGKTPEERYHSDQRIWEVNPYQFARRMYNIYIDSDKILDKSMGNDQQRKVLAFNMLTDPRVAPFTDRKAVIDDFAIEPFGGDDPDKYKLKDMGPDMLSAVMGNGGAPEVPANGGQVVPPQPAKKNAFT